MDALAFLIAYAFLQTRRLAQTGRKKESQAHHHNPAYRLYAKPSLTIYRDLRRPTAPIVVGACPLRITQLCQS